MLPSYSRCFKLFLSLITLAATLDSTFGRNLFERSIDTPVEPQMGAIKTARELLLKWRNSPVNNNWEDGDLFEGDIKLPPTDVAYNGVKRESLWWSNGVIPFKIEGNYNEYEEDQLKFVMEEFNNKTCIKFRPYENSDEHYIVFKSQPGCWSHVGCQFGAQDINLQSDRCFTFGTIAHELLHVIGFWHQQSANDRDNYVTINWDNIVEEKKHNFIKYGSNVITDFGVEYDYKSIMHYNPKAFTKNNKDTISPLDPKARIGQQYELSEKDILKIRKMYKCDKNETN